MCDVLNYSFDEPPDGHLVDLKSAKPSSPTFENNNIYQSETNTQQQQHQQQQFELRTHKPIDTSYEVPNNSDNDEDDGDDNKDNADEEEEENETEQYIRSTAQEIFHGARQLASFIDLAPEDGEAASRRLDGAGDADSPYDADAEDAMERREGLPFYGDEFSSDEEDEEEEEEDEEEDDEEEEEEAEVASGKHAGCTAWLKSTG